MNIGIAGAGSIVPAYLEAARKVGNLIPYAICASRRSQDKMEWLSDWHGIEKIYYDYDQMTRDPALGAVYLAVPNHLHYEFAKKALEAGLHVICEKPFCSNAAQLEDLMRTAEEKGRFLFEAISNLYFPNYRKVRELLEEIGRIHIVEMNFSQYSSRYDAFLRGEIAPAFSPEKSGGALMDLNVYSIHFVVGLFGKPEGVRYFPNMQRRIDTSGVLILRYPDFVCTLTAAKDCGAPCHISIQGEKGCLVSDCPSNSLERFFWQNNRRERRDFSLNTERERLFYELEAFSELVSRRDFERQKTYLNHSLTVQDILDEARRTAGIEFLEPPALLP